VLSTVKPDHLEMYYALPSALWASPETSSKDVQKQDSESIDISNGHGWSASLKSFLPVGFPDDHLV